MILLTDISTNQKLGSMKKLFTLCATAFMVCTLSAQTTIGKGEMVAGFTYNSEYENDAIMDDLAITVGYGISDEFSIMATRDENTPGDDATINLGLRYFKNGFYGQLNMNDVQGDSDTDPTLSIGKMFDLDWVDGLYADPSLTLSRADDDTDMSFGITIGMFVK